RENKEPVIVDFYVTKDLPQNMKKLANEFYSLLKEYRSLSNTDFVINTIHPDTPEKELKATQAGIDVFFQEFRDKDLEKIQRIFIGAVFHIGDKQAVIPRINFDTPIEYRITSLFKQMTDTLKPTVGFIRGHGEATFAHMPQFIGELSHLTEIQFVDLNQEPEHNRYNVICIIDPKDNFSAYELEQLEKYLEKGGRLFIALNHAIGQLGDRNSGFINPTGIEDLLEKKGLKIKYDFVVDNNCGTIAINQQYGFINFQSNISFPYVPVITNFSDHTITQGLKSMLLPFASSIEQIKTSSAYIFTPLAQTSSISGIQQAPVFFDFQKQWTQSDFNRPHNTVAALLTNEDNNSSIVTITDADFISESIVSSSSTDNIKFAVNSIEWLADNSGLIQLRNKFTTFSFLEPINDHTKEFLKYLNFLLPILLVISGALVHYRIRQRKRINRSRPGNLD
ncbi:MAG: GldG family protein, partial [Odoribacter sp.]|nr:GldG family protein [Odoribacter sp.]